MKELNFYSGLRRLLLSMLMVVSCAVSAIAADYDFVYFNLQFLITGSNTVTLVGPNIDNPSGNWSIPATATSTSGNVYKVTKIGEGAFSGCSQINSITIGNNVTTIGDYAFDGTTSMTFYAVANNNTSFTAVDGVLYSSDQKTIVRYPCAKSGMTYDILDGTETIGPGAFNCCANLMYVDIPDGVTYIGGYAFEECTNLIAMCIPSSIERIEVDFLCECTSMRLVNCAKETVPSSHSWIFESVNRPVLYVPSSAVSAYESSALWGGFKHIVGYAAGLQGDVDGDGTYSISDVTALIDVLLTGASNANSDVDGDGMTSISDVTALIDMLLTGQIPEGGGNVQFVYEANGVPFVVLPVEGGTFTMGATSEQGTDEPENNEYPVHEVTLSSYSIGQTEVTQALWQAVMGSNPSSLTGDLSRPVEKVTWNDCQTFITTLNEITGKTFGLLTEAEWEFAARGGNLSQGYKYAGSDNIDDVAWYIVNAKDVGSDSPDYGTHAVATKVPNELGLYDMSGNVYEWCQDWYGDYSSAAQTNPTGPTSGYQRVARGGTWFGSATNCRVSFRASVSPSNSGDGLGLRLAL